MKKHKKLSIDYDATADVFYLSFGQPKPAVTEEHGHVGIRRDMKTNEVVGITIVNFLTDLKRKNKPIEIPI